MTVQECYEAMGGSYDEVLSRFRKEERIQKFLGKFLADPSYETLRKTLAEDNRAEAFRAAHTLKGVAQNLGLVRIYTSSSAIAEILRGGSTEGVEPLMEELEACYHQAVSLIRTL